jgi:TM2 domain-containing membrane protein YozV
MNEKTGIIEASNRNFGECKMNENPSCPFCRTEVLLDCQVSGQMVSCPTCNGEFRMPYLQATPLISTPTFVSPTFARSNQFVSPPKNPGVSAVLSFLFLGLGQIYNGQIGKAIMFWLINLMLIVLGLMLAIPFLMIPILWIYGIFDAYSAAEKLNRKLHRRR